MKPVQPPTRREFIRRSFAFSAVAALAGCSDGIKPITETQDPVTGGTAHFLMVGDWGQDGNNSAQQSVAFAMQAYAKKYGITTDALLLLGDNMYGTLNGGALSPRFNRQFEQMYPVSAFNCPALAVPGNHDYQVLPVSKFQAEVQYASSGLTRWTMPGGSYTRSFPVATSPLCQMIFLDSNMLNEPAQPWPPPDSSYYALDDQSRIDQIAFLQATLAQPRNTPWLFVIGHHPLYSNGMHGDNATLIRDWDPLFRQYGVDLYLAGHDHDLQHIQIANHPTSFVSSGAGGAPLYAIPAHKKQPGYIQESFGFTHLQVKPDQFIVRHLDTNGNLLHKFTKLLDGTVTVNV